jgi:hypothetical protein
MDKVDWIITGIISAIMIFCFFLGSRWSFFCAGICATCLFIVNIGRFAHMAEMRSREKQWEKFMDNLESETQKEVTTSSN